MDFFQICTREAKGGVTEIYPDFTVGRSKDLMVRGKGFYAIWDEEQKIWSTDEYDVQRLVDRELRERANKTEADGEKVKVKYLQSFTSNVWTQFRKFMANISDNSHQLDEKLTFAEEEVKKSDYVSRRLPYSLDPVGFCPSWDEMVGLLYSPEERAKIEWAIGAVLSGDAKKIQKFLVLYGPAGTGKSTILNIIERLFEGYTTSFEAKALASNNNAFATEVFGGNPLVAIQHDGDLSKIEDNSKLNSIISHEYMTMNAKYKPMFTSRINAFLFMGTNKPVKISDAKSGIIRRLIDVQPTGEKFKANHYNTLMAKIEFELGAIAQHCLEVYRQMGKNFYNTYRPMEMMLQTDVFFNFVEAHYDVFKSQDGVSLKQAYALYKVYCEETGLDFVLPQYKLRDELRNYFDTFHDRIDIAGSPVRSYYSGFTASHFKVPTPDSSEVFSLVLEETTSLFDTLFAEQPAQLAKADGTPAVRWSTTRTTLADLDTTQEHYVKLPLNHIVIDFDLKDDNGRKSLELNLGAASSWPPTYAELSRGGEGVHLHYTYVGDVNELSPTYSDGIEVKVFTGNASLRRRVSKCNNVQIAPLSSGLPYKEKKVLSVTTLQSEKGIRDLIGRNLRKEIHPGTKPSVDFIAKILDDAYLSKMTYDVTDLRAKIVAFANNSTNQPLQSLQLVQKMKFKSADAVSEEVTPWEVDPTPKDDRLVFFDVEVYPNLFLICWKYAGDSSFIVMVNPTAQEVESLFQFKLIGFNVRRYDNHMLWARYMGYSNEDLYKLSKKIIDNTPNVLFGEAYNLSYADIYDFSSVKQSLKKFQIDLGIHHVELDLPWDLPVEDSDIPRIVEYCCNDVASTEATFNSRAQDFVARQILAELSGLSVNDTTKSHTAKIIFGKDRNPQRSFKYTNLSKEFPGYEYDRGKSTYRGELVGEGGYVYAEPGMYQNVAVLDVASMHPTSIALLNLFGDYTPNFAELTKARIAIKRGDFASARKMLGGKLAPYLQNESQAKELSYALKIIINIVYGLTSAKFDNPFRDMRNKDNIVAKRGALFMIDLKNAVQAQGYQVVHIKTDSIKVPEATPEIIQFINTFGKKYGYDFEHEVTYDQFCLVNDAVYIARVDEDTKPKWTAVGAQFQHPYVFKKLFSCEEITLKDYFEAKQVTQGAMYLDFDGAEKPTFPDHNMHFVGRTGLFVPVVDGGGVLYRVKEEKLYAVSGTKGYRWIEAETLKDHVIDMTYYDKLVAEAEETIETFGSFESFVS